MTGLPGDNLAGRARAGMTRQGARMTADAGARTKIAARVRRC